MTNSIVKPIFISSVLFGLLFGSVQTYAASQCKGLESSKCDQNASCTWIDGYERKDGRKVSAFCRAKPKSKLTSNLSDKQNKES